MIKWTLVTAQTFRKIFAPALLLLTPLHSQIWFAVLGLTVLSGVIDVVDAIRKALK